MGDTLRHLCCLHSFVEFILRIVCCECIRLYRVCCKFARYLGYMRLANGVTFVDNDLPNRMMNGVAGNLKFDERKQKFI